MKDMSKKRAAGYLKDLEALGKGRLLKMKIDFNNSFQKKHAFQFKKNHWRYFCIYVGLGQQPYPDCAACQAVMDDADATLADAVRMLPPIDKDDVKKERRYIAPGPGAVRGRPKQGTPAFSVWNWISESRPGQYEKLNDEGDAPRVKCLICKSEIEVVRCTNNTFIIQHERSVKHKAACSGTDGCGIPCEGVPVSINSPVEAVRKYVPAFEIWAAASFPWLNNAGQHECYRTDRGAIIIRSSACKKEGHNCKPDGEFCIHCEKFSKQPAFLEKVARWAVRIQLVDLLHATLTGASDLRSDVLAKLTDEECFSSDATGWEGAAYDDMSFPDLFQLCRQRMAFIPQTICNAAASAFLETRFMWLSGKKFESGSFVGPNEALKRISRSIAEGASASEIKIAEHVLNGKLRSDSVMKTLVTALVIKCSKNNQVRKNTNTLPGVDEAELAETGFALSTCAQAATYTCICTCITEKVMYLLQYYST